MSKTAANSTFAIGGVSCSADPVLTGSAEKAGSEMVQDEVAYLFFLS